VTGRALAACQESVKFGRPGGHKLDTSWAARTLAAAVALALVITGCAAIHAGELAAPKPVKAFPAAAPAALLPGVFEPGVPKTFAPVAEFARQTRIRPAIVLWYSGLDTFPAEFAETVAEHGATPFVQINPGKISMSAVAAGQYDGWINAYAASVRAYRGPVLISWAAEANGPWDSWGHTHTPASTWVAAWRHVVTVFRRDGAVNAGWVWTMNAVNLSDTPTPLREWWPGSAYVTWAGIDGYYYRPSDTWASVFAPAVAQIKAITDDPILIGETAVDPSPSAPAQIEGLFASARRDHLAGVVWFDQAQHAPPYHDDWHLADNPAALSAYRSAVRGAPETP
jgi:mannan endo-1,4-beta-mannosidase